MSLTALLPLLFLPQSDAAWWMPRRADVPRPAACTGLSIVDAPDPPEHADYPPIGERWPVDVPAATIIKVRL